MNDSGDPVTCAWYLPLFTCGNICECYILGFGCNVNVQKEKTGLEPWHRAAAFGHRAFNPGCLPCCAMRYGWPLPGVSGFQDDDHFYNLETWSSTPITNMFSLSMCLSNCLCGSRNEQAEASASLTEKLSNEVTTNKM